MKKPKFSYPLRAGGIFPFLCVFCCIQAPHLKLHDGSIYSSHEHMLRKGVPTDVRGF